MSMNILTVLRAGRDYLHAKGIENPSYDADMLMMKALGDINRMDLFMYMAEPIEDEEEEEFFEMIKRRGEHYPLQYILGKSGFYGLEFEVDERVLIPRADTESLVEAVLERVRSGEVKSFIDIGTGSGAIAVSLVKNGAQRAVAFDVSCGALEVAKKNADKNGVGERISFVHGDILNDDVSFGEFDAVVSNPPYIRADVIPTLMEEVKDHEPMNALDGGGDGLIFYREITKKAAESLKVGGWLFYEIGYDQGEEVSLLLKENGFECVEVRKDLAGNDRVVMGRKR